MNNNILIIIDPNNDFVNSKGSLYVPESEKSIGNLCDFINTESTMFRTILVVQDTHPKVHIGNPNMWHEVEPFSSVTVEGINSGKYKLFNPTEDPNLELEVINYIGSVEGLGRNHVVWPEHCIEGTWGWEIPQELTESLINASREGVEIVFESKGCGEELKDTYSLLSHADGSSSGFDVSGFSSYDKIYICGFAKDICVAYSVKDLTRYPEFHSKLVFLDDCMESLDSKSPNLEIYEKAIKDFGALSLRSEISKP